MDSLRHVIAAAEAAICARREEDIPGNSGRDKRREHLFFN
jgi:hypothetical protein